MSNIYKFDIYGFINANKYDIIIIYCLNSHQGGTCDVFITDTKGFTY